MAGKRPAFAGRGVTDAAVAAALRARIDGARGTRRADARAARAGLGRHRGGRRGGRSGRAGAGARGSPQRVGDRSGAAQHRRPGPAPRGPGDLAGASAARARRHPLARARGDRTRGAESGGRAGGVGGACRPGADRGRALSRVGLCAADAGARGAGQHRGGPARLRPPPHLAAQRARDRPVAGRDRGPPAPAAPARRAGRDPRTHRPGDHAAGRRQGARGGPPDRPREGAHRDRAVAGAGRSATTRARVAASECSCSAAIRGSARPDCWPRPPGVRTTPAPWCSPAAPPRRRWCRFSRSWRHSAITSREAPLGGASRHSA